MQAVKLVPTLDDHMSHGRELEFPSPGKGNRAALRDYVRRDKVTSEFYGVSLAALKKILTSNGSYFPNEDKKLAATFVKEIEEKWFTPPR